MGWLVTPQQKSSLGIPWEQLGNKWTPSEITTALWLDAADASTITQSGGLVSQWNDKSGNSRNFTAVSGTQPTTDSATQNNKNVLVFSSSYLTSSSASSTWKFLHDNTKASVFGVVLAGNNSNPNALYGIIGSNASTSAKIGFSFYYDDRSAFSLNDFCNLYITAGGGTAPVDSSSVNDAFPANAYQILCLRSDPANSTAANRSEIIINGGSAIKTNTNTAASSSANPTHTLQIGATGSNTFPFTGRLAEFVFLSGLASTTTQQNIEGYLAHKWGLTANLPSDHPYKSAAPTR